jgi:hypothetical protein
MARPAGGLLSLHRFPALAQLHDEWTLAEMPRQKGEARKTDRQRGV